MAITKNLHIIDRTIRGVVGLVLTGLALFNGDFLQDPLLEILLGIFGTLNFISLLVGWCPVYQLSNISTLPSNKNSAA
ncbi:YgaP family membrane protein [Marinomonas transparens]|uniref:DUF2892 domain-containing protein n=1 Tax=Marinomonas transparens TaxID=2795388 RepID=A0A934JRV1_9GAMM|nr:DUF2892 domain-containing protein [Marinomonas transparens]MBJ7538713.1 DUF2892 domain-containing protein [Marinomonas transparens]